MEHWKEKYKEDFHSFLDEIATIDDSGEGKEIVIGNFSSPASQVLESLDEVAYEEQFLEFIQQKREDHKDVILNNYPAPIAYYFERTQNSSDNPNHRLHLLRSTWESLIYILYGLVMAEVNRKNFDLRNIRIFNNQRIRNDHNGSLSDRIGLKLELIKKIIEYDCDNDNELRVSELIRKEHVEKLEELNQERNSFSHVAALAPAQATTRYDHIFPEFYDLLFDCDFLSSVSLLIYYQNIGSINNVRFKRFDGHSLREVNYDKELSTEALAEVSPDLNDKNLLIEFEGSIYCVSPFIHFAQEGDARRIKLCFFKKLNRENGNFIFEKIEGDTVEFEVETSIFRTNINDTIRVWTS